jgi:hypothetical protein
VDKRNSGASNHQSKSDATPKVAIAPSPLRNGTQKNGRQQKEKEKKLRGSVISQDGASLAYRLFPQRG